MTVKVFVPTGTWNVRAGLNAESVLDGARAAEAAGLDGVFAGDHVTFYGNGNDGLVNLAPIAAVTSRLELKTCVYLLALRHPTAVALQCAMLDQLSNGRFSLGVGVGGEDPQEFRACGVDPATRGARTNEAIQVLRSLWTQEETTYRGKHFDLDGVRLQPKPLSEAGIRIQVGGRSDFALRRVARYGDGWTGLWNSSRRFIEAQEKVAEWAHEAGRADHDFEFGMQFWCAVDNDRDAARERVSRRMEGFYRLPFSSFERYVPYGSAEEVAEFIEAYVEAGCQHANLVLVDESAGAVVEAAAKVRALLNRSASG
ncbi:MAG TPA: LLM class flavin-dependent oxidoreductase [Dehalococcoidia bacterium]|nr:LLM class flavin-dependent oxidoreductase [Dehalococcoidia bacterium]